ncbi:MAG TPA: SDR family NAD(P)-dependent oxidoreductase, partial [Stellaceae bacterium]|nr:SDR family NAD(P)-dependent oxidoreductase [Stellaceae bacterium]
VDVVLNSLSGEATEASLELLKPFGRFVELGKRDFQENRQFQARLLRQNVAFFAVDIDQLPVLRPTLARTLLHDVAAALSAGEIRPLAHRAFPFAEIVDAFRLMQGAEHIGKLVLQPDRDAGVAVRRRAELRLHRDGVYIVTGGLSGFGFAIARWLAEHGAGGLALIGRRGNETPGIAARIADLEAMDTSIAVYAADVADEHALAATLDAIRNAGVPIRGVVHAAAEIIDGTAAALSADGIATTMRAKLGGALLLDRLTRDDPLDLFCLFSSATTVVGAPGQGAYVAANAALEALARRRHAERLPALAIAWGPISDAGVLADRPQEREALARRLGTRAMSAERALSALPELLASHLPVVALADVSSSARQSTLPGLAEPMFAELRIEQPETMQQEDWRDRLATLSRLEQRELLATMIADEVRRILRLPAGTIDRSLPLVDLGMDSLTTIELRLALESRFRCDLPLTTIGDGTSISALAARLVERVGPATTAEAEPAHRAVVEAPVTIDVNLAADE